MNPYRYWPGYQEEMEIQTKKGWLKSANLFYVWRPQGGLVIVLATGGTVLHHDMALNECNDITI